MTDSVLITGANGGLGNAVTRAFLDAGALVTGVSRKIREKEFDHPNFRGVAAELSGLAAAQSVVQGVGRVDVLVHLVGAYAGGQAVADTPDQIFDQMMQANLRSAFDMIRAVLPGMRGQRRGCILAIGSKAAVDPQAMSAMYNASKAALLSLVRTMAIENGPLGIRANVVLPGTMDTPANRAAMAGADFSKWVKTESVASLLVYLASEAGAQVNGAAIPVYGVE